MSDDFETYDHNARRLSIEELCRDVALGIDDLNQGLVDLWDPDDLKRRVRERLRQLKGE